MSTPVIVNTIELSNTFNEFRVAYNDTANSVKAAFEGGSGNTAIYASGAQFKDLSINRLVFGKLPTQADGA